MKDIQVLRNLHGSQPLLPSEFARATTEWSFSMQSRYANVVASTCASITRIRYARVTELTSSAHVDLKYPLDGPDDSSQPHGRIFLNIYDCKEYFGYVMIGKIRFSIFNKSCRSCCSL
jgi:hypothetical protein